MTSPLSHFTRREFIGGFAAASALYASPLRAQDTPMVVGTWGGDYGNILREKVDGALMRPLGIEVHQEIGQENARLTKILAERGSRRGTYDIACLSDSIAYVPHRMEALEEIDETTVPNYAHLNPIFRKRASVPHIYTSYAILYDPNRIQTAPTDYEALLDSKNKGVIGFSDIGYRHVITAFNIAAGGTPSDFSKGKAALLDIKERLNPKIYPSNEAVGAALQSGEIAMTPMYQARGYFWKKGGAPIEIALPEKSPMAVAFELVVPKNARSKEAALKYLNTVLEPSAQAAFAEGLGYMPTTDNANIREDLVRQIGLTSAQTEKLYQPDQEYMLEQQSALTDFWNKEFKA